jgi:hypothetical protein
MTWQVALRLGRVSNLPTVWTNTAAGIVVAGGTVADARTLPLLLALSLFYLAGMFLNDAFDRAIDARDRPERPIPAGEASATTVFGAGFGMIAAGVLLLLWVGYGFAGGTGIRPALAGLALGGAILLYDWRHKGNPLSPVLMGLCRTLVYLSAGLAFVPYVPQPLVIAAVALLCYLIGLTYIAKQETLDRVENLWPLLFLAVPVVYGAAVARESLSAIVLAAAFALWLAFALRYLWRRRPGDVPRAVGALLAGISLLDAVIIAGAGSAAIAWLTAAAFLLNLGLQRFVAAT